eukprot:m.156806 g.156806  ORF g.156806 m.156806 type:complete len:1082 (-) comp14331_c5_seq1:14823-18068(-)
MASIAPASSRAQSASGATTTRRAQSAASEPRAQSARPTHDHHVPLSASARTASSGSDTSTIPATAKSQSQPTSQPSRSQETLLNDSTSNHGSSVSKEYADEASSRESAGFVDLNTLLERASFESLPDYVALELDDVLGDLQAEGELIDADKYLEEIETDTEPHHVSIGILDYEELTQQEKNLQAEIAKYEEQRHKDIVDQLKLLREQLQAQRSQLEAAEQRYRRVRRSEIAKITVAFQRAEQKLLVAVKRRQAEVIATYGSITLEDGGLYSGGGATSRRYRIDWSYAPRPLTINVLGLRGLRDKAPKGRYCIVLSRFDRLGGNFMRLSRNTGSEWFGSTDPFRHGGSFTHLETVVHNTIHTMCPSERQSTPALVLVFELYLLRSDDTPLDHPVGWGAFPMLDAEFNIPHGFFKIPLLRGMIDPNVTHYAQIEECMHADLDNWLCNMYVRFDRRPRFTANQREYEVELQYTSALMGYPKRKAGKPPSSFNVPSNAIYPEPTDAPHMGTIYPHSIKQQLHNDDSTSSIADSANPTSDAAVSEMDVRNAFCGTSGLVASPEEMEGDDQVVEGIAVERVQEEPGLFYTVHTASVHRNFKRNTFAINPARDNTKEKHLTAAESLQQHRYSVRPPLAALTNPNALPSEAKTPYVMSELTGLLGWSTVKTTAFWYTIMALLLSFWGCMFIHYSMQWVLLLSLGVPVSEFTFLPYTVNINYQASLLLAREQLAIIVVGSLANNLVFIVLVAFAILMRFIFKRFPSAGYQFLFAWGVMTSLDTLTIFVIDLILRRWRYDGVSIVGDAFKLYWHFENADDGGLPGAGITIFVDIVLIAIGVALLYAYLLHVHMNRRVLDLFHRYTTPEHEYYLPYDNELSLKELEFVKKKAERWRGARGERRKVLVQDIVLGSSDDSFSETTTHVTIFTLHHHRKTLFRQFLCLPDGAIVEVFGSLHHLDQRLTKQWNPQRLQKLERETTEFIQLQFGSAQAKESSSDKQKQQRRKRRKHKQQQQQQQLAGGVMSKPSSDVDPDSSQADAMSTEASTSSPRSRRKRSSLMPAASTIREEEEEEHEDGEAGQQQQQQQEQQQ